MTEEEVRNLTHDKMFNELCKMKGVKEVLDAVDYAKAQVLKAEIALHLSNAKEMFGDDIPSLVECSTVTEAIVQLAEEHPDKYDVKKLIRGLVAMHLAHIHTDKKKDADLKEAIKIGVERVKKEDK